MGTRIINETLDSALSPGDYVLVDSQQQGARKFDLGTALANIETAIDTSSGGIPSGGTSGQFLVKSSATDYDVEWVSLSTWSGGNY